MERRKWEKGEEKRERKQDEKFLWRKFQGNDKTKTSTNTYFI